MDDIDVRVGTIDNPKTITVSGQSSEPEIIDGLQTISGKVTTADHRGGYTIDTYICHTCGTQDVIDTRDKKQYVCSNCRSPFGHVIDRVKPMDVEAIINSQTHYKCLECGQSYDKPTPCCVFNRQNKAKDDKELHHGWYCTSCTRIYDWKPTACHSDGELIEGNYYFASRDEFLKKTKLLIPR